MATGKAPAYQMYAADFAMATMGWPSDPLAAHIRLMNSQWINDGLPDDIQELACIAGLTPLKFRKAWERLESRYPVCQDGKRRNVRLESERQKQQEYRDKQANAAAMRWHKPAISQKSSQTDALQSSSSTPKTTKSKAKPSAALAPVDERKAVVREAIKKGYCWANKTQDCPWGAAEEIAMNAMFIDVPKSFTAEMLVDCVRNRFLSEDVRSDPPRKWIRMILTWKEAPLDRFGKPKTQGNGNGKNGKPNKATERFNSNVEAIAKGFGLRDCASDDAHGGELAELQHLPGNGGSLEGRVATDQRPIRLLDASGDGDPVHSRTRRISADSRDDS